MTTVIQNLSQFVQVINEGEELDFDPSLLETEAKVYGEQATHSLMRQWAAREDGNTLRVSSLGRPAVLQALTTFGYHEGARPNRLRRIFSRGDVDEAELIALMNVHGLEVEEQQREISWNGVLGHLDGIVDEGDDGTTVFDVKTTQPYKFDTWKKKGIDNDAYLTQIAVYQEATGTDNAAIIVSNKANSELFVQYFDEPTLRPYRQRALRVIQAIRSLKSIDDIFSGEIIQAPPLEQYICKRKEVDGVFVIPESMRYSPFRTAFYHTYTEKDCYSKQREFADGYKHGTESREELARLVVSEKVILKNQSA